MDTINRLPEDLRSCIISRLPTIEAVRTSVLSSQWRNTWAYLSELHFDSRSMLSQSDDYPLHVYLDFMDFVYSILLKLKSKEIKKFYLRCEHEFSNECIADWIGEAARLNAWEIIFHVNRMELPSRFFVSEKLTILRLYSLRCGSIAVPKEFCFPNLKYLDFFVNDPPNDLTQNLFRSCPKLECLTIKGGIYHGELIYDISCPLLTTLEIVLDQYTLDEPLLRILLDVPSLLYLDINDKLGVKYALQSLSSPISARVAIGICRLDHPHHEEAHHVYNLFQGISGVKSLFIDAMINVLRACFISNAPTFQHLTCLEVVSCGLSGWAFFFGLLESAPNLSSLIVLKDCDHITQAVCSLEDFLDDIQDEFFNWNEPELPPECLRFHLKYFGFEGFFWVESDMKVIKYLLQNAEALETLMIKPYYYEAMQKVEFREELSVFPWASGSCVLVDEPEWLNDDDDDLESEDESSDDGEDEMSDDGVNSTSDEADDSENSTGDEADDNMSDDGENSTSDEAEDNMSDDGENGTSDETEDYMSSDGETNASDEAEYEMIDECEKSA